MAEIVEDHTTAMIEAIPTRAIHRALGKETDINNLIVFILWIPKALDTILVRRPKILGHNHIKILDGIHNND